ncbi:MAG: LytTR family DNA-binding domain-containing protein [Bacteroidales bacterium]|nr:LytTR family DNA-binding domain-containing protein [Bacteroidales bacterium]
MDSLTYSCIAVDDEAPALEKIKRFIEKVPFLQLKASFDNAISAMSYLKKHKTDILFLDIQMDELSGIQLVELLDYKPVIIFTTAYEQYAMKGYELDVSDYLLKPYSFERFLKAVNKALRIYEDKNASLIKADKETNNSADFIFVKTEYRIQKIFVDKILYIEGMKDYLKIVMLDDSVMTLMNFATLQALLPETNFVRVHKSYIVALNKIECIERDRIIINKERVPVGETYRGKFFNIISGLGGGKKQ